MSRFVRILPLIHIGQPESGTSSEPLISIPIEMKFIGQTEKFDKEIREFVLNEK
jgi:hypothetical protein